MRVVVTSQSSCNKTGIILLHLISKEGDGERVSPDSLGTIKKWQTVSQIRNRAIDLESEPWFCYLLAM
jgi:hypothetical protein